MVVAPQSNRVDRSAQCSVVKVHRRDRPCCFSNMSSKGKGKIRRKDGRVSSDARVGLVTGVSHVDSTHGVLETDLQSRYFRSSSSEWLPYLQYGSSDQSYKPTELGSESLPFLLVGSPILSNIKLRASDLITMVSDVGVSTVEACCVDSTQPTVMECQDSNNVYGSPYHVREPKTRHISLSLEEFQGATESWTASKLCVNIPVRPDGFTEMAIHLPDQRSARLAGALSDSLNWGWIETWRKAQCYGACVDLLLHVNMKGIVLAPKYELTDRLVVQVAGRSRVTLFNPKWCFEGMYPFPLDHAFDRYAMVDLERPDLERWPRIMQVRGQKAILSPGDAIYIPAYWFAFREDLSDSVSLSFHFAQGTRTLSDEAVAVYLSREIEGRLGDIEGIQNVRRWIEIVATDSVSKYANLETVKGYKRIVVCQGIIDDAEAVVGPDNSLKFLKSIIDGRLEPTSWLNADFRERLFLTDVPVIIEDDRTDEEKKYPELFRHQLRDRGWSTVQHARTIPIPGYHTPLQIGSRSN